MREGTWSALVAGAVSGAQEAVVGTANRWSRGDLADRVGGVGAWLTGLALPRGRPVPALVADTGPALALVIAGAAIGRPIAPLGSRLTVAELAAMARGLGGGVLLAEACFAPLAAEVAWATGSQLVVLPDPLPVGGPRLPAPEADDVAMVLHTSGTTGAPKAIAYRQRALAARVRAYQSVVQLGPGDVFVTAAGFHHIAGLGNLAVAVAAGATVVSFLAFSIDAWRALTPLGVTHALLVPTMIEMLLAADALALPALRWVQYGAAPIHPDTLRAALAALPGVRLANLFGQTEGSPLCVLTADDHHAAITGRPELLSSVGRAAPGVALRVEGAGADGVGELCARGDHVFAPGRDGWLRTGDLARIEPGGYVYLAGRTGDTINRGGENVRPLEVETLLRSHPAVADAAVAGVPDRRLGEEVAAWVVPADESSPPSEEELTGYLRARLAGFKVPRRWAFVESLPRGAAGKLSRRALAETSVPAQGD
ncbi:MULTISPECIES: class I adenylate-forming enzyme family protein [unclassified Pseudofrankia]|uniref:class I adenylate-forming enzyme family protein n=1 Tax=unclassified Pseudofrankia TaxID=2994372 RepID=UPI000AF723BE|nr:MULTISPECIES: class I adenylate-forming enzyme family protein [unclassified Pseudofrankia]MDT3441867.1 class I adenylate-forming enzyme family protein [Pseudofrankia sp. BMG5.37]